MNYSSSLIAMIETARRTPTRRLAQLCDEVFGTPETFTRHEKRLRGVPFSAGFRPFEPYESEAVSLRLFEHTLFWVAQNRRLRAGDPGHAPEHQRNGVEERLAARMARQAILTREHLLLLAWALLDEDRLR